MAALFLKLLRMSFSGSLTVAAVLILRFVLRKGPKWPRCVLWTLVAARLVCPILPESPLSLQPENPIPPAERYTLAETPVSFPEAASAAWRVVGDAANRGLGIQWVRSEALDAEGDPVTVTAQWWEVWLLFAPYVWLAGLGAMLLYALGSWLRLRRRVREAVRLREGVWYSDRIAAPFILGILRPRIYLPAAMDGRQVPQVLAHETAHLRRRDHWWKPLGFVLLAVYWFNPVFWLAYALLCRDIELACDEKVVREYGPVERKAYAEALLSCSLPRFALSACPLAFGEVGIKERIRAVVSDKKPGIWLAAVAVLSCGIVALCFLTNPKTPHTETGVAEAPAPWDHAWLEPPVLTLRAGEPVTAYAGAYDWRRTLDGQRGQKSGDSVHPLLLEPGVELPVLRQEVSDTTSANGQGAVLLEFETPPETVRAYCWSDAYWETGRACLEPVRVTRAETPVRNQALPFDPESVTVADAETLGWFQWLRPGGYVYEIVADWGEPPQGTETGSGTVCYWFYGVLMGSERDGMEELPYRGASYYVPLAPEDYGAESYGITEELLRGTVLPDFASLSLEALGAYDLHMDAGSGEAECAGDWLFRWFLETPDSVLIYLARVNARAGSDTVSADSTAEELLARAIAAAAERADAPDAMQAFQDTLRLCQEAYPTGTIARILELL